MKRLLLVLFLIWFPFLAFAQEDEILAEAYLYNEADQSLEKEVLEPETEIAESKPPITKKVREKRVRTTNKDSDRVVVHDFNIQGELIGGERQAGSGGLKEWQGALKLNYSGSIGLTEKMSILLTEDLDGMTAATDYSPVRELNHPSNSITRLGLGYSGVGKVQARAFTHLFFSNDQIGFPIAAESQSYLLDASLLHKNRSGFDLFFEFPIKKKVMLSGDLLYTNLTYEYNRFSNKLEKQHDADLWARGLFGIDLAKKKKFSLLFGGLIKHDLNESTLYNMGQGYAGFESVLKLFKKKLDIRASLLGRYYASPAIGEGYNNYADDIGLLPHIRFYWKMKPRFYLKGDFDWELAPTTKAEGWFFKQRYELALRKAGKNLSSMEFGGWMSAGSYQPRMCLYGNGLINLNQKFHIIPSIRSYFMGQSVGNWTKIDSLSSGFDTTNFTVYKENGKIYKIDVWGNKFVHEINFDAYQYYRTDLGLTLRHKFGSAESNFFKKMSFYYGALFQVYTNVSDFQSSFESPFISNFRLILGLSNFL